jgi:hypothetical protein
LKREVTVDKKSLKELVDEESWQQCSTRLKKEETAEVLHKLFDYVVDALEKRIDEIKADDGRAISFFSREREILTINVTRKDLRIYIHPPARAFFDPKARFKVEKFRFWEGSYQKTSGKYRALSIWISKKKFIPGVKKIIEQIPEANEQQ